MDEWMNVDDHEAVVADDDERIIFYAVDSWIWVRLIFLELNKRLASNTKVSFSKQLGRYIYVTLSMKCEMSKGKGWKDKVKLLYILVVAVVVKSVIRFSLVLAFTWQEDRGLNDDDGSWVGEWMNEWGCQKWCNPCQKRNGFVKCVMWWCLFCYCYWCTVVVVTCLFFPTQMELGTNVQCSRWASCSYFGGKGSKLSVSNVGNVVNVG